MNVTRLTRTLSAIGPLALVLATGGAATALSPPGVAADPRPVRFAGPDFGVGGGTLLQHLDCADLNGDGHLDAVAVNQGADAALRYRR